MSAHKKVKTEPDDDEDNIKSMLWDAYGKICGGDLRYVPVVYLELSELTVGFRGCVSDDREYYITKYLCGHKCTNTSCRCDQLAVIYSFVEDMYSHSIYCLCRAPYVPLRHFSAVFKDTESTNVLLNLLQKERIWTLHLFKKVVYHYDVELIKTAESEFESNPFYWNLRRELADMHGDPNVKNYSLKYDRLAGRRYVKKDRYRNKFDDWLDNTPSMRLPAVRARERKRAATKMLLLCARHFVSDSVFAVDNLPLDMFKIIVAGAALLPPVYFC